MSNWQSTWLLNFIIHSKRFNVIKLSKFTDEFQSDSACRSITVFCNDNISHPLSWSLLIFKQTVIFSTINERNDIRILLNCSRLPQVRKNWALISTTLFYGTTQLRKCNNWYI